MAELTFYQEKGAHLPELKGGAGWGKGKDTTTTRTVTDHVVAGMHVGSCYTFRAYRNHKSYLTAQHGLVNNSNRKGMKVWRVVEGKIGKGTISLVDPKSNKALRHQNYRAKLQSGKSALWRADASYHAGRFTLPGFGKNAVSF